MVSELQEDFEPVEDGSFKVNDARFYNMSTKRIPDKTPLEDIDAKQMNDEFDSTINSEISEITSEAFDACWMGTDTKWRRSPEGEAGCFHLDQIKNIFV